MIQTWRDEWLREFFERDTYSKRIPSELRDRLFCKLQALDDATVEADLRHSPGDHFEKLRGNLEGWYSIRVNQQWSLIFEWADGKAKNIYLYDHSYR